MSKIKLTGDTSGYVEISAPNVAANNTLELGGGTKILTNLDNVFTGVTTYSGNIDLNANLDLDDNNKILLGTGDDIEIFHNGTDSFVRDVGTGSLYIDSTSGEVVLRVNDTENAVVCRQNAEVELYHNGSQKLETTATGATVTGTLVSGSVTSELDLTAISSSITDTAVDIFVYDTRKDSDGGAWRKRTQHTSWYNETLGTATRGSRKEFPAVAVIVAENDTLTIYDGDDPDLPMWMVFNAGNANGNNMIGRTNENTTCTSMLNGLLCVGREYFGFHMINFIADRARFKERGYDTPYTLPIGTNRNGGNTWLGVNVDGNDLVDDLVNDVAMTVLPNAPIDDSTGLPVPTIAVGTDGGVSVIKDNGTVFDITITTGSNNDADRVDFTDDNRIVIQWGGDSAGEVTVDEIPSVDTSANYPINLAGSHYNDNSPASYSPCFLTEGPSISNRHPTAIAQFRAVGTTAALSVFEENRESEEDGMVAFISSSYNTGYQQGRIKGAFLSDTDTTNIVASEMVTNGTFDSNTTGWSVLNSGTFTASGGQATLSDSDGTGTSPVAYQAISGFVVGRTYVLSYDTTASREAYAYISQTAGQNNQNMYVLGYTGSRTGTQTVTFVANSTNMVVNFSDGSGSDFNITVDNVSVKLGDKDRSLNNNGARVFGTVTKSAVATGAELVGYSGFTGSNYMTYNASNMNFGTGDFSVSVWCIPSTDQSNEFILELDNASSGSNRFYFLTTNTATKRLYLPWDTDVAGSELTPGEWNHIVVGRKSGYGFVYVNNRWISDGYKPWTTDLQGNGYGTISNYSGGVTNDYAWSGSLALLRISGSAPSAEQVSKMYEDEKVLFKENAKATLYGSSDAVTALAYDKDTELLHVGTSAGRSDFQGLRRINNTTTAVTTAISASDDFIAEQ